MFTYKPLLMAIIREWRCRDCGTTFESFDPTPACPTCVGESERAFLTPPNINSGNTRRADKIQQELAQDFGISNMSNRYGQPVKSAPSGPNAPQFGSNQRVMQTLAGLGSASDGFSQVAPLIKQMGNPRQWNKTKEIGK